MGDTRLEYLKLLEAKSLEKQQVFMDHIARRLRRPRITEKPEHPFRGAPDFWQLFEWTLEEKVHYFTENFLRAGGHVVRLNSMGEAKRFIVDKSQELQAQTIIRQNEQALHDLDLEGEFKDTQVLVWNTDADVNWKACAAEADIGIVLADDAAAYTGSIIVLSSEGKGRSVSLLPTVLIVIVPVERLRTTLGEVLIQFDRTGREGLPAGIHFISGPSRSADIENDLTIGVHGPGVVYTLIVG